MSRPKKDKSLARIIGRRLYDLRKSRKLRQKDIARVCDISVSTLNIAESGQVEPTLRTLRHLADFYGVTLDELTLNKQKNE